MGTGVEADPWVSPSPPFHMLSGVHSSSSVHRLGLRKPVRAVAHQSPPMYGSQLTCSIPAASEALSCFGLLAPQQRRILTRAVPLQTACPRPVKKAAVSAHVCAARAIRQLPDGAHAPTENQTDSIRTQSALRSAR